MENSIAITLSKLPQPRPMPSHAPASNALSGKKANSKEQNRKLPNDDDREAARRSLDRTAMGLGFASWAAMLERCHTHDALYRIDLARPGLVGAPDALGESLRTGAVVMRAIGFPADLVVGAELVLLRVGKDHAEIARRAVHVRDVGAPPPTGRSH
jgi:hypothetical protein